VLRYAYEFSVDAIAVAYTTLLRQENVTIENAHHNAVAVNLLRNGVDFADALHLACSQNHTFVTFDKKLATRTACSDLFTVKVLE